ncbi:MAG: hypothetical protein KIT46_02200 [Anaerolineales bacterium]|nr:hypothetical protein [Anaerolineales bacterium]MCW5854837.1 hypothetical protein [Anaerolineales bacterium]
MSQFDPTPDTKLLIDGEEYAFTQQRGVVYAEIGKAAKTFRIKNSEGAFFALKVFFPGFRGARLLNNNHKIKQLSQIQGLRIAQRKILAKSKYRQLIEEHGALENSILMPWVEGQAWANFLDSKIAFSREESLQLAKSLATLLANFEGQGIAHCDLSSKNIVFKGKGEDIQFVDIEEIYSDGFVPPSADRMPAGSPGYSPGWIRKYGLWQREADRFAGAILLAEILAWSDGEVRSSSAGETFFYADEVGGTKTSHRFTLIRNRLNALSKKLEKLFVQTWSASKIERCASLASWHHAIQDLDKSSTNLPKPQTSAVSQKPTLQVSPTMIDFGTVDSRKKGQIANAVSILIRNTGHEKVEVKLTRPNWILLSETQISLGPGESQEIQLYLLDNMPTPAKGDYYHFVKGLVIDSNGGNWVLGGKYQIKRGFF